MGRAVGYRDLLRNRRFVLFEVSAGLASVGYSVYAISIPWLALELSGNLLVVGLVLFAEYGVYTLTFLVAPWVDRARNKRTVFLACYPAQAALAVYLGLARASGQLGPVPLLLSVVLLAVFWDFAWAAYNIVPPLLLPPEQQFRAQGLGGLLGGATQVGGFAAGGVLVLATGPSGGMLLYAALLVAATGVAALVSLPSTAPARSLANWVHEFREGWARFARHAERSLLALGSSELLRGFFTAAPPLLITAIAGRSLSAAPSTYTALFVAWVLGGVTAGLALGEANPRGHIGTLLVLSAVAEGGALLVTVVVAGPLWTTALLWAAIGAGGTAYVSGVATYLRGTYPASEMGRISANLYTFTGVASSAGALVLGSLAARWTPAELGAAVGGGFLLLALVVYGIPSVRRLAF